jgi:hypothetical protein
LHEDRHAVMRDLALENLQATAFCCEVYAVCEPLILIRTAG